MSLKEQSRWWVVGGHHPCPWHVHIQEMGLFVFWRSLLFFERTFGCHGAIPDPPQHCRPAQQICRQSHRCLREGAISAVCNSGAPGIRLAAVQAPPLQNARRRQHCEHVSIDATEQRGGPTVCYASCCNWPAQSRWCHCRSSTQCLGRC